MAMANLLLTPPPMNVAPKPKQHILRQHSNRLQRSFAYTPPTSFSTRPVSLRLSPKHAAASITPLLKKHKGFGGNMNSSAYWAASYWDDVVQADKKFPCLCAAKEDNTSTVTENKDDKQAEKRKSHKAKRMSSRKPSRKIYVVIVVASFCVVLAVFSFVLPKQRCILMNNFHDAFSAWTQQLSFESIESSLFAMLQFTMSWISMFLSCYRLYRQHNFGKMRNRKPIKNQSITFDNVQGVDAAKAELLEIVLCMEEDSKYMKLGAKVPRGVLVAGPPGTGKTFNGRRNWSLYSGPPFVFILDPPLLARAVAGEADMAFFSISASEFVEIWVGQGAARVRDLFREARKRSPSIIFIDEIDAVGGKRGMAWNSERDQTLNQLLTEMDGFEKSAKVVVMAATNRPEILDSALMRPGRFSRKVVVGEPDLDARRRIFSLYLKEVKMEEDKEVICDLVASLTPGLVGADLENIANESVLLAARRDGDFVTKEDFLQAVERATTKICNNDIASEAKSPYLFGRKALERIYSQGRSWRFGF